MAFMTVFILNSMTWSPLSDLYVQKCCKRQEKENFIPPPLTWKAELLRKSESQ